MKGLELNQIKDKIEEFFPLKPFILSFSFLLLTLIVFVSLQSTFNGNDDESIKLTGKIIAEIKVTEDIKIEEPSDTTANTVIPAENTQTQVTPEDIPNISSQDNSKELSLEDSIAGLSESSTLGPLPIIRKSDGLSSFKAYQVPFTVKTTTKGVISLVAIDFGLSDILSKSMIETLPLMVTFATSPYAHNLQEKVSAARQKGYEVWMGIPMQGNNVNVGPNSILAGLNNKENTFRLNTHLGKATGYAGIAINAQTKFPDESPELQALTNSISSRGLGIAQLESHDTIIGISAAKANAPFVKSNMWIDKELTKEAILKSLAEIEKIALEHGTAVAAFTPSIFTATVIEEWQRSLDTKNIQLAPLTYSTKMNMLKPESAIKKDEPK
jgi:polysaccharide deacetylase 2 family uncharacterized protein YibQ